MAYYGLVETGRTNSPPSPYVCWKQTPADPCNTVRYRTGNLDKALCLKQVVLLYNNTVRVCNKPLDHNINRDIEPAKTPKNPVNHLSDLHGVKSEDETD